VIREDGKVGTTHQDTLGGKGLRHLTEAAGVPNGMGEEMKEKGRNAVGKDGQETGTDILVGYLGEVNGKRVPEDMVRAEQAAPGKKKKVGAFLGNGQL